MDQLSDQNHLIEFKKLGVRTDKKIEVMYSDLYRITENIFHTECLLHEGYEAEDFFQDPKFSKLRELKKHLEEVMEWMFPKGLPEWPKRCQSSYERLRNPYLSVDLDSRWNGIHSSELFIAAFNIRCGKPGEQFKKDREYILEKLEKKHYCLSNLKNYCNKDSALIPPIGIAVMEQKIYFPNAGKVYADGVYNEVAAFEIWKEKYQRKFKTFSNNHLQAFYNNRVGRDNNSVVWKGIIRALQNEFQNLEIDISSITIEEKLATNKCAILVNEKLHSIEELPTKIIEQMIMLHSQERAHGKSIVSDCKIKDGNIYYLSNYTDAFINGNHLLNFFSDYLIGSSRAKFRL
ncbi:hypothetical protein J0871_16420 [Salegentibacter sp. BDJ18]|uniref:hypothetical protein n=1 Tax=Salegentibacter sp. BDJ18 TaxID=2816376 RepID=UPI001AAF4620|nr:hypothetical protein [Salegentibacter sp. BDJ18]MBO2546003.1 hypothetical protein [Salegentibacter sp. BDJ18]